MKISFWEKTFENDDTFLFGAAPNKTITEFEQVFDKNWSVLDVGCGDGKNAIYLAENGFFMNFMTQRANFGAKIAAFFLLTQK